ncbi:prepilin-type N-terminal cleavage/methylation domain-containing protein [Thiomicrorhabdus lithotrophica]|uniref:Prepilin-type N-terminal cleavage/methylation domain-containing protein n=1 Tax=Thiomicrorhabdus lithotrophica TaxID=2949997 RepID=A0ABY8C8G3_9GAMM|nr:prepilin-type N-terminal cleavage/methylation domain-containing protein [Thiomicrorhabdus lithotrophica]WEJ62256.1 prepilin-type N-terminal cleavage/methylation domain-containing protein [Thiomicrorhabdus lithotrophica]
MQVKNLQTQKGFTLVEIAIVLVIIGLLLGGVLKGQELITNAKIKAVTSDFDNISAAVYAYQDRTGNLPGDGVAAGGTTTYDGAIADNRIWIELRTEGFIGGDVAVATGPSHDLSGIWSALPGNTVAAAGTAGNALFATNHICASNIPDNFASGIDAKLDDGNPDTGNIRSATMAAPLTLLAAYANTETLNTLCKAL